MIKINKIIQTHFNLLLKVNQQFHQIFQKKDLLNLKAGQLQIHIIKVKILQIFNTKRKIQIRQIVNNSHSRKLENLKKYQLHQIIRIRK
jgi:hypothetical protein